MKETEIIENRHMSEEQKNLPTLNKFIRKFLSIFRINIRQQITPGISILGYNFYYDNRNKMQKHFAESALEMIKKMNPKTVLDVGSGGGFHANELIRNGANVTCIDLGTSIYAKSSKIKNLKIINTDFNYYNSVDKFELVWASHILEHQRNIGLFIEKLIECCEEDGHICITVPDPHRNLWGGHLSIWSPGFLAYNIVMCGLDISSSIFIGGHNEFSILFRPIRIKLPDDLTYDHGDISKLSCYFPQELTEGSDPWNIKYQ